MHLTGMEISESPPFTDLVELDFDWQVNLFIGPNASGKSALLREIDAAFNGDRRPDSQFPWRWNEKWNTQPLIFEGESRRDYRADDWRADNNVLIFTSEDWTYHTSIKKPPVVYIGPVRAGLPELHDDEATSEDDTDVSETLSRQFSGANLKVANEKMHQKADAMFKLEDEADAPLDERRAYRIFEVRKTVYSCVRTICAEVLSGDGTRNYVTGFREAYLDSQPFANFYEVTIHRSLGINTIDQPNFTTVRPEDRSLCQSGRQRFHPHPSPLPEGEGIVDSTYQTDTDFEDRPTYSEDVGEAPLYAGFLSSGTQSTFLWIYWLVPRPDGFAILKVIPTP